MTRACSGRVRSGIAAIWVLVVVAALTAVVAIITSEFMAGRRELERRQHQLQAQWLARSGVERAAARLLSDPTGYGGESVALIPGARVRIEVSEGPTLYRVTSEARYPAEGPGMVVRTETRRLKRVVEKDRVRIEVLATDAR